MQHNRLAVSSHRDLFLGVFEAGVAGGIVATLAMTLPPACAVLSWRGRLHPLWLLGGGAVLGLLLL